jgi:hypothetical protein
MPFRVQMNKSKALVYSYGFEFNLGLQPLVNSYNVFTGLIILL